jgi:hypothetical protein
LKYILQQPFQCSPRRAPWSTARFVLVLTFISVWIVVLWEGLSCFLLRLACYFCRCHYCQTGLCCGGRLHNKKSFLGSFQFLYLTFSLHVRTRNEGENHKPGIKLLSVHSTFTVSLAPGLPIAPPILISGHAFRRLAIAAGGTISD